MELTKCMFVLAAALLLESAGARADDPDAGINLDCVLTKETAEQKDVTCTALKAGKLEDVSFHIPVRGEGYNLEVKSLDIFVKGKKLQTLEGIESSPWFDKAETFDYFVSLVDFDFDENPDIQLFLSHGAGPNAAYMYWLFNAATGKFVRAEKLDVLSGFEIVPNPETKTISVSGRSNCCSWEGGSYAWVNGELEEVSNWYSGTISLGSYLPDKKNIANKRGEGCGTINTYLAHGVATKMEIITEGGPCGGDDKEYVDEYGDPDYREREKGKSKRSGIESIKKEKFASLRPASRTDEMDWDTVTSITDEWKDGLLMQRTVVFGGTAK